MTVLFESYHQSVCTLCIGLSVLHNLKMASVEIVFLYESDEDVQVIEEEENVEVVAQPTDLIAASDVVYDDDDDDSESVHPVANRRSSNFDEITASADFFVDDETMTNLTSLEYQNGIDDDIGDNRYDESKFASKEELEMQLKKLEPTIDEYLNGEGDAVDPTPEMISYARYNWLYNTLSSTEKMRLNRIRFLVEGFLDEEKSKKKAAFWNDADKSDQLAMEKVPICAICRYDIRNDFNILNKICVVKCGHVFHTHCVKRNAIKFNVKKCCVCNTVINHSCVRRLFLSYK